MIVLVMVLVVYMDTLSRNKVLSVTKFERIQKYLDDYWGFRLYRNSKENHGRQLGNWKTGYSVSGFLRGAFIFRYNSLAEIERCWMMKDAKGKY